MLEGADASPHRKDDNVNQEQAIKLIDDERKRQIEVKGFSGEHDRIYNTAGELVAVAGIYYGLGIGLQPNFDGQNPVPVGWPQNWSKSHYKPKDKLRNLVRAGALAKAQLEMGGHQEAHRLLKLSVEAIMAIGDVADAVADPPASRLQVLENTFANASRAQVARIGLDFEPAACLEIASYLMTLRVLGEREAANKAGDVEAKDMAALSVPERLAKLGDIYRERNKVYKDTDKKFGRIMVAMFPDGLSLKTEEDFSRVGLYLHVVDKVSRYGSQFSAGGHQDSLNDTSVYSQMLQELDAEIKARAAG
jgi:hypothetical protein